jgi:hypothetical protein
MTDLITWLRRWRECRALLRLEDQTLADIGCSRALLRRGVPAWPWQATEDSMARLGRFRLGGEARHVASSFAGNAGRSSRGIVRNACIDSVARLAALLSAIRRKTAPAQRMIAPLRGR